MEAAGPASVVAAESAGDVGALASEEEEPSSRRPAQSAVHEPRPTQKCSLCTAPLSRQTSAAQEPSSKDHQAYGSKFHEEHMYVEDLEQPLPSRVLYPESSLREANTQRFSEEGQECTAPTPRLRSSRMFKGKGKEVLNVERDRRRPLQLLDLPVDVLKDIVKGVTHTNDLTSLALCHSALHRLAIPHIYSRFDIVWPDTTTHAETRSGVDALTYGLATLVFAEELFDEAPEQRQYGNNRFASNRQGKASTTAIRRRRGNHYAQFTKKFSLGNGPEDWVKEYLITKEAGKMLGTLVAIAVARMRILETFIWDMPTGVLRDVWLALSSHGDREDGRPCRLEKVWVRWHDNISPDPSNPLPAPPPLMNVNAAPINTANTITPNTLPASQLSHGSLDHVENPSFSILPPLKSLSVLDIDELSYLDEMAVLIGKSCDKLRELRVGIAAHAVAQPWLIIWEGDNVQQIDRDRPTDSSLTIGTKRLGGVLGTLTGLVCDMREPKFSSPDRSRRRSPRNSSPVGSQPLRQAEADTVAPGLSTGRSATEHGVLSGITSLRDVLPDISNSVLPAEDTPVSPDQAAQDADSTFGDDPLVAQSSQHSSPVRTPAHRAQEPIFALPADALSTVDLARKFDQDETEAPEHENDDSFPPTVEHVAHESLFLKHRLQLTSLELERVPLSIPVLEKSIDWSRLTSLTLLHCQNHDQLWKTLRRSFAPVPRSPTLCQSRRLTASTARRSGKSSIAGSDVELEYRLKLTRIHTNTVSMSLISFLKDTLAPNSLEVLFLQEGRGYSSPVTVDQIFKGPLRRHRNSLTKVMIDSSEKGSDGAPSNSNRWRRWLLSREILGFICSGKMPRLRELGMAIDYRDWHFFLQHLPSLPQLRSLSVPYLADHVHGVNVDARELALQIVDIVALRPEIELCYMGIANKCFEILENARRSSLASDGRPESHLGMNGGSLDSDDDVVADTADDGEGEDGAEGEDDGNADADVEGESNGAETDEDEVDGDDDDDDDSDSDGDVSYSRCGAARLKLREILFYDDKVAIFKGRHGRL